MFLYKIIAFKIKHRVLLVHMLWSGSGHSDKAAMSGHMCLIPVVYNNNNKPAIAVLSPLVMHSTLWLNLSDWEAITVVNCCPLIDAKCLLGCGVVSKRQRRRQERSWRRSANGVDPPPTDTDHVWACSDGYTHSLVKSFTQAWSRGGPREGGTTWREKQLGLPGPSV